MLFLSFKQLFSRIQQTILTLIALVIGTAGYIVLSGVFQGFQETIEDVLVNDDGHIKITPRDETITPESFEGVFFPNSLIHWITPPSGLRSYASLNNVQGWFERLKKDSRVYAYSPRLSKQVLFKNGNVSITGTLVGVNPDDEQRVTTIDENVVEGKLESVGEGESIVVIGEGLMNRLGSRVGGSINIVNSEGDVYPVRIKGVIYTGIRQIDDAISYSSLHTAQKITDSSGEVTTIAIRLYDVTQAASVATNLGQYSRDKVQSWDQANENLLSIFETQNIMKNAIIFTIILIVSFGIYNILNMVVNQKKKEVAILRSIGYRPGDIVELFLAQGMILGLIGSVIGLLLGALAVYYISQIKTGGPAGGEQQTMQVSWSIWIYIKAFLITMTSSIFASIIPARLAARFSPIEVIRGAA